MKERSLNLGREEILTVLGTRAKLVTWLIKKGKGTEALALAEKIRDCRRFRPCRSGACPVCGTKAQLGLARAIRTLAAMTEREELFTLTVAPEASAVPVEKLKEADHANHERRLKRALHDLPVKWLLGATDFSLNEHRAGRYDPFWMPHLYLIGAATDSKAIRGDLKALFPASEKIPRPIKLKRWDGRPNALLYAFKIDFYRRVGRDDAKRFNREKQEPRSCRATEKQRLRSAERLELLLHLDRIGISTRMFSLRSQIHRDQVRGSRWKYSIRTTE